VDRSRGARNIVRPEHDHDVVHGARPNPFEDRLE
jgi:hypothetical protein